MIMFGHRYRIVIHLEVIPETFRLFALCSDGLILVKQPISKPLFRYVYVDILFYHHGWSVHAGQQADHVGHTATQLSYMHFCAGM